MPISCTVSLQFINFIILPLAISKEHVLVTEIRQQDCHN